MNGNGAVPASSPAGNPTTVGEMRVKTLRRRWRRDVVYEINHDDKTVQFYDSAPMPLRPAEEICVALRADLDQHKPAPAPRPPDPGPELAPDFLQVNINRLLEIPAGHVVRPGPRLLRWLWPYVIVRD